MSLATEINGLFQRDLERLITELSTYTQESDLWLLEGKISNTAGNLALHLIGNLRHFIGHMIGGTSYQRNRDVEFSAKNIPLEKILHDISLCQREVEEALLQLEDARWNEAYPLRVMDQDWTNRSFVLHLIGHLNYHLGQINYHRRLLTS